MIDGACQTKIFILVLVIMAQAIDDPTILDGNIAEACEQLNQLSKKERDIKTKARIDLDNFEKNILLRRYNTWA